MNEFSALRDWDRKKGLWNTDPAKRVDSFEGIGRGTALSEALQGAIQWGDLRTPERPGCDKAIVITDCPGFPAPVGRDQAQQFVLSLKVRQNTRIEYEGHSALMRIDFEIGMQTGRFPRDYVLSNLWNIDMNTSTIFGDPDECC